ncbi:MAG: amidase, partial [Planctomycetaceae bacterium]|nr:amidase [Planctomycetaceae bacterium]
MNQPRKLPSAPNQPDRRAFIAGTVASAAAASSAFANHPAASTNRPMSIDQEKPSFELSELSIDQLQEQIKSGEASSRSLVDKYIERIEQIDDQLRSVIELNPDARAIAEEMDRERSAGHSRGPLHGIPVMVKDNIDSADKMKTAAGSLALVDAPTPR